MLMPPGSNIDPSRADNTEVYMIASQEGYEDPNDPKLVEEMKSMFAGAAAVDRAEKIPFSVQGKPSAAFVWDVQPKAGTQFRIELFVVTAKNHAIGLVGAGLRNMVEQRESALKEIAATLDFAVQVSTTSDAITEWTNRLRGKVLTQLTTSTGVAARKDLRLFPDGTFSYHADASVSVSVGQFGQPADASGHSSSQSSAGGHWRVVMRGNQVALELKTNTETSYGVLTFSDGKTFVNGTRTFVTDPK
jgi:hypothetical protein